MLHQQTSLMADIGAQINVSVTASGEADRFSIMIYGEGGSTFLFLDKGQMTKLADSLAKFRTLSENDFETHVVFADHLPVAS